MPSRFIDAPTARAFLAALRTSTPALAELRAFAVASAETVCTLLAIWSALPAPCCACGAPAAWLVLDESVFRCSPCHVATAQTGAVRLPPRNAG